MSPRFIACLFLAAIFAASPHASAQLDMGRESTLLKGATVWMDGKLVENCDLLISGRRVKAVGKDFKLPDNTTVVDMKGKFILPALIDSSSTLGMRGNARRRNPEHSVIENVDLFNRDPFQDALERGVGYAYLTGATAGGVGARGQALRMPTSKDLDASELALKGTESLHVRLGQSARGPVSRAAEIKGFEGYLKNLKGYKEKWEKYEEDLKKYEEELAEWAKKNPQKGKKSGDKAKASTKKPAAGSPAKRPVRRRGVPPRPGKKADEAFAFGALNPARFFGFGSDEDDHDDHDDHGDEDHDDHDDHEEGDHENEVCEDGTCTVPGEHAIHVHDDWVFEADLDGHEHGDHGDFPEKMEPGYAAVFIDPPLLRPRNTHIDDGTEPHLRWERRPSDRLESEERFATCPHCGANDPLAPQHIAHSGPWKVDAFDDVAAELRARYYESMGVSQAAFEDPKKPQAKGGAKKPTGAKKGGKPKKPKEPGYKPDLEVAMKALDGKIKVRIEVHRAEDILAVLDVLKRYPLDAVLEGVTEGRFVAEAIAKAELPVILGPAPSIPFQEQAGGASAGPTPRPFPGGFRPRNIGRASSGFRLPVQGETDARNAAELDKAGVSVVIASLGAGTESLLDRAAFAVSRGLSRETALGAITTNAAQVLGMGDQIGEFGPGRLASFSVFNGDPFMATTRVESVYIDGKQIFKN